MGIAAGNKTTLSGDGTSDWVKIPVRENTISPRLVVGNGDNTWGSATRAAIELCLDATAAEVIPTPLREDDNSTPVVFSENDHRTLENISGYARMAVTDYSGSDQLTLQIQ